MLEHTSKRTHQDAAALRCSAATLKRAAAFSSAGSKVFAARRAHDFDYNREDSRGPVLCVLVRRGRTGFRIGSRRWTEPPDAWTHCEL